MNIICNVTGSERKRLAQALGAILLTEPIYTKAIHVRSTFSDKTGTIICPDSATPETVAEIIAKLTDEGFTPEISNGLFDGNTDENSGTEEVPGNTEFPADSEDGEEVTSDEETPAATELSVDGEAAESSEEAPGESPAETPDVALEAEAEAQPAGEATEADVGEEMPDVAASEGATTSEVDQPVEEISDEKDTAETEVDSAKDDTKLTISIPRDKLTDDALARLRIMVSNISYSRHTKSCGDDHCYHDDADCHSGYLGFD